jgi:DNA-binding transcriptional MerR regulator
MPLIENMSILEQQNSQKLYYSISEIATMIGEAPSLIRFWETKFPTLCPRKGSNGTRLYTPKDIKTIKLIHHLVKEKGYTLEGAKLEMQKTKTLEVDENQINNLKKIRSFLTELITPQL